MCGRYYLKMLAGWDEYAEVCDDGWRASFSSYNIAPSTHVPAFRILDGKRHASMLRWGLVPFFARGEPPLYSTINATIEKLETGPVWRGPWRQGRRCILPASGFFEWQDVQPGKAPKQPYAIEVTDQPTFGFAAIWDKSGHKDGYTVESCAIITLPASPLMAQIHNVRKRMPAILRKADHETWLSGTAADARGVLIQYPDELLRAYRIGLRVNSPRNNDASLLEPLVV
jgi:putative SOS response-associated peptidase YedK